VPLAKDFGAALPSAILAGHLTALIVFGNAEPMR
jgi:hypothetical protein